jgi:flagellar basal body P-ring formation protein FlgA
MITPIMILRRGAPALFALIALATLPARADPMLRPAVTVDSAVIHLGDLFSDAGAQAADIVAPAPPPGSRTIFDAAWLADTAREHQLDWQPASRLDQASVERATRTVTGDEVAHSLLAEIGRRQSVDGAQLQLDNPGLRLFVPASAPSGLDIVGLTVDPHTGRFSATVSAQNDNATAQRVTGRLIRMVKLAVLARALGPGDVIGERDITTLTARADRIPPDAILAARDLVGKSPRRLLRADEPLRVDDVQMPVIVHKGDLIILVLQTPFMRLTAQAKALDDGGMNAVIRVANTKSNRMLDATVIGPNLATVTPPAQLAARAEEMP